MSSGDTIVINSKEAFPAKIAAIRTAIEQLRAAAAALPPIGDTAVEEASSFTRDGQLAPVYSPLLQELRGWLDAVAPAVEAVCDSAENCAATLETKFNGITSTDTAAADAVTTT